MERFIDPSVLPFIVTVPFTGLTVAGGAITADTGVISEDRDFYGFILRSRGDGLYQWKLTDGDEKDLSLTPIDGINPKTLDELIRNLGDSGRLIPIFAPKGTKITIVFSTTSAGPIAGQVEIQGETIKG